jgi:hypothetical protein
MRLQRGVAQTGCGFKGGWLKRDDGFKGVMAQTGCGFKGGWLKWDAASKGDGSNGMRLQKERIGFIFLDCRTT